MCWKVTLASRWHPYYWHIKKLKKQTRLSFKHSIYRQAVQFSSLDQNLRAIKITGKPTTSGFSPLLVQNEEYGFASLWTLYLSLLGQELLPGKSSWNFWSCVGTKEELWCFASPSSPHIFGQCLAWRASSSPGWGPSASSACRKVQGSAAVFDL